MLHKMIPSLCLFSLLVGVALAAEPASNNTVAAQNETVPAAQNGTVPASQNGTVPAAQNGTVPAAQNSTVATAQNGTVAAAQTNGTATATKVASDPNALQVNVIRRFWCYPIWFHHFYVDSNLNWDGKYGNIIDTGVKFLRYAKKEPNVGYVVAPSSIDKVDCDKKNLVEIARYQRIIKGKNPVSHFAPTNADLATDKWEKMETFVCVKEKGQCGADHELIAFPFNSHSNEITGDLHYPANEIEISRMKMGHVSWSRNGNHVCYLWTKESLIPRAKTI